MQTVQTATSEQGLHSLLPDRIFLCKIQLRLKYSQETPKTVNELIQIIWMEKSTDLKRVKF